MAKLIARLPLRGYIILLGLWLMLGFMVAAYTVTLVPAWSIPTGPSSGVLTQAGGIAMLCIWFGPLILLMVLRHVGRAQLSAEKALAEQQPWVAKDGTPNLPRFRFIYWRSGLGLVSLLVVWLVASPFVLWFYAFFVQSRHPAMRAVTMDSPYTWGGIAIVVVPMLFISWWWMRQRDAYASAMRGLRMRPLTEQERQGNAVGGALIFVFTTIVAVALATHFPTSWTTDLTAPFRAIFGLGVVAGGYYLSWRGFTAKEVADEAEGRE